MVFYMISGECRSELCVKISAVFNIYWVNGILDVLSQTLIPVYNAVSAGTRTMSSTNSDCQDCHTEF